MKKTLKQTRSSEKKPTKTALKTAAKKTAAVKKPSTSSAKPATKKVSAPVESGAKKPEKSAAVKKSAVEKAAPQKTARKAQKTVTQKAVTQKAAKPAKTVAKKTTETAAKTSAKKTVTKKAATKKTAVQPVKVAAKKTASEKAAVKPAKAAAKKTGKAVKVATKTAPAKTSKATPRAVRKRAPKDLADQYGQQQEKVRAAVPSQKLRKRRSATVMAKLREAIAPDEEILQRLARAGMISSKLAPEHAPRIGKSLSTRRSRKWKMHCGKCDTQAEYTASAALCVGCGTILVRSD